MKHILISVIIYAPGFGFSTEKVQQHEFYIKRAMRNELDKPQVAGGVVYLLEDGGSYFDHRIAVKVAREYFRVHQKKINMESVIKALESDEAFVRDASFELIKLLFPKRDEEIKIYNPFEGEKTRAQSLQKLKKLLLPAVPPK
jgi:hypothetical protein